MGGILRYLHEFNIYKREVLGVASSHPQRDLAVKGTQVHLGASFNWHVVLRRIDSVGMP